ncbi:MAG: dipicolinate synthase subunit DpsA [Porcipelethomonas sp.]
MSYKRVFLTIGGDLRQVYAARKLSEEYRVYVTGFDRCAADTGGAVLISDIRQMPEKADYIILPIPASDDGVCVNSPFCEDRIKLSDIPSYMKEDGIIFAGKADASVLKIFSDCKAETVDYFNREEFNILNAVPTAEGAIMTAIQKRNTVLYKSRVLITGYGRISRTLIKILSAFGADITAAARKYSDLAWAQISGCHTVLMPELASAAGKADLIINTVPALVIDKEVLSNVRPDTLIIDLASKPGGVDFEAADKYGIRTIHALAIPGKNAPVTAGEIIACTVLNILRERRRLNE